MLHADSITFFLIILEPEMPHDLHAINIKQFSENFPVTIVKWKVSDYEKYDLDMSTR